MSCGCDNPDLSVVIPVYGSEKTLEELHTRVTAVLEGLGLSFEIIFVDDASPDGAWKVLKELHRRNPAQIKVIQLMRNYGQHNALMCGFRQATGEVVITMDDDLQNPPEEISKLLQKLKQSQCDLVYGKYESKKHAAARNLGSSVVNWFFRFVFRTNVTVTSFRAIRRELVQSILNYDLNFTYIDGLLAWNTQRVTEVTVEHHARNHAASQYSLAKLVTLSLNLFTNFSLLPLQLASGVGVIAAAGGIFLGGYFVLQQLLNNISVPGYASIIVAVLTLGGTQLLALGVIGEYIGRLHLNVNRKPQYTVRDSFQSTSYSVEAKKGAGS